MQDQCMMNERQLFRARPRNPCEDFSYKDRDGNLIREVNFIFKEADFMVSDLLHRLTTLYQKHNLDYPVTHLKQVLLRMLTPFQLKFIAGQINELFSSYKKSSSNLWLQQQQGRDKHLSNIQQSLDLLQKVQQELQPQENETQRQNLTNRLQIVKQSANQSAQKMNENKLLLPIIKQEETKQVKQEPFEKQTQIQENHRTQTSVKRMKKKYRSMINHYSEKSKLIGKNNKKKIDFPSQNSNGYEKIILSWILKAYLKDQYLTPQVIRRKAAEIGKAGNLRAGRTWLHKFTRRNPIVKQIIQSEQIESQQIHEILDMLEETNFQSIQNSLTSEISYENSGLTQEDN